MVMEYTASQSDEQESLTHSKTTIVVRDVKSKAIWQNVVCVIKRMKAAEKVVALRLSNHLNLKTGRCDPGHDTLANECGVDERTSKRAVKALLEVGLIERKRRRSTSNSYVLVLPENIEQIINDDFDRSESDTHVTSKGCIRTP